MGGVLYGVCGVRLGRILRWLTRACDGPTHSMRAEQRKLQYENLFALVDSYLPQRGSYSFSLDRYWTLTTLFWIGIRIAKCARTTRTCIAPPLPPPSERDHAGGRGGTLYSWVPGRVGPLFGEYLSF